MSPCTVTRGTVVDYDVGTVGTCLGLRGTLNSWAPGWAWSFHELLAFTEYLRLNDCCWGGLLAEQLPV